MSAINLDQLQKLAVSIRGKLQFMDFLVRAAVADVERYVEETDAETRVFIRQLIEMHASHLAVEAENTHPTSDSCDAVVPAVSDKSPPKKARG